MANLKAEAEAEAEVETVDATARIMKKYWANIHYIKNCLQCTIPEARSFYRTVWKGKEE